MAGYPDGWIARAAEAGRFHDPDMDPRDYQDATGRYDDSRALLYPIPQTGSEAQDEAYARWFLHAVVARHKHLRNELSKEIDYLQGLLDSMDDIVADRPNYTGSLYLMKAIHDHQIDQIQGPNSRTIYARLNAAVDRYMDLGFAIYVPGFGGNYQLGFALEQATELRGRLDFRWPDDEPASLHLFVDILLRYIRNLDNLARLKAQAELPNDDSDPEFGPYMDALDGINARWRQIPNYRNGRPAGFVNLHRLEAFMAPSYEGGWDDFGNSVYFNNQAPRSEGRFVADYDGSTGTYYEPGRREPWTGD